MEDQILYYELKPMNPAQRFDSDDLHERMDLIKRLDAILQAWARFTHLRPSFALHDANAAILRLSQFRPRLPEGPAT
jgi:hypothetical protein